MRRVAVGTQRGGRGLKKRGYKYLKPLFYKKGDTFLHQIMALSAGAGEHLFCIFGFGTP
jgi:hypothetical protein